MGRQRLVLCADYRFGANDQTLWPQPYLKIFPYLGSIPKRPVSSEDPLSVMWWNPLPSDFTPSAGGVAGGLGKLSIDRYNVFKGLHRDLQSRAEAHIETLPEPKVFPLALVELWNHTLPRLAALPMSFEQVCFCVTDYQRLYLEVRGLMDYVEIYKPRMDGKAPRVYPVADCIGVFTTTPIVVQQFFRAGLPVWFIRTTEHFRTSACNASELVKPISPTGILTTRPHPDSPPEIYNGVNDDRKHTALYRFSRDWLSFKDPFSEATASSSSSSAAQHQAGNEQPAKSTKAKKSDRKTCK